MLALHDYDRYRILDEVVRGPDYWVLDAEIEGRRVSLVTAPPVPAEKRLTVLHRLAEREALDVYGVAAYVASGIDETRTWVAFDAGDGPTLEALAASVRAEPELDYPAVAARVIADTSTVLRELLKVTVSLPASGFGDARLGEDGRLLLSHLGEVVSGARLEESGVVYELGSWLKRLGGSDPELASLADRCIAGNLRRLVALADELERWLDDQLGATRADVVGWRSRHQELRPRIPPPALLDDQPLTGLSPGPNGSAPVRGPAEVPAAVPAWVSPPLRSLPPPGSRPVQASSGAMPALLGNYRLRGRVTNGMSGRVFEGEGPNGEQVAVKLLVLTEDEPALVSEVTPDRVTLAGAPEATPRVGETDKSSSCEARFLREAEALTRLTHPNIVQVVGFGVDENAWIAMARVPGVTLAKRLRAVERLSPDEVIAVARQLCSALGHAHSHGVIHRDLKPANVFLVDEDVKTVKLADFGLAREFDGSSDTTNDGSMLSAPHYVSPEQCNGLPAIVESDLYGLGMLMYRMLTGGTPFKAKKGAAVLVAHLKDPIPTFASLGDGLSSDCPAGLEAVVRKCLEKRPESRYRSALALDFALRACTEARLTPPASPARPRRGPYEAQLARANVIARDAWTGTKLVARGLGPQGVAVSVAVLGVCVMLAFGGATSAMLAWGWSALSSPAPVATVVSPRAGRDSLTHVIRPPGGQTAAPKRLPEAPLAGYPEDPNGRRGRAAEPSSRAADASDPQPDGDPTAEGIDPVEPAAVAPGAVEQGAVEQGAVEQGAVKPAVEPVAEGEPVVEGEPLPAAPKSPGHGLRNPFETR